MEAAMTYRRLLGLTTAVLAISAGPFLAAQKVQVKDLPAAVQKGVQDNLNGGTVKTLAKEKEDGKTVYEVESTLNGKTRDFMLDATGHLLSVEDEIAVDALPPAVKTLFEKQGTIVSAEKLTKGAMVAYEAKVEKHGKKSAVGPVDANGKKVKE
jgi:uncharacterized membrane protein YkoI